MSLRVAINGFGRIGRMVFRKAIQDESIEIVAINASYPTSTLAHLIKYDTIHGMFSGEVTAEEEKLIVNNKEIRVVSDRNPANLPWAQLDIDVVVEATGKFRSREGANLHLEAGAKKVVITAPGKDEDVTIVMGVNENAYNPVKHQIISNASCTTNGLAPIVKVLHSEFGIENGLMTTVHAYTNDQLNLDNPHKDLRRARACGQSIIPTKTGAAKAIGKVLPELDGKLNGLALRVPTPNVSIIDLVVDFKTTITVHQINEALREASQKDMKGIIEFCEEPLVSSDFNGSEASGIVDALSTMCMGEKKAKILIWYDNEWGYSCRVVDLLKLIHEKNQVKNVPLLEENLV